MICKMNLPILLLLIYCSPAYLQASPGNNANEKVTLADKKLNVAQENAPTDPIQPKEPKTLNLEKDSEQNQQPNLAGEQNVEAGHPSKAVSVNQESGGQQAQQGQQGQKEGGSQDQIQSLPGLKTQAKFKQYSGYLKSGQSKNLFYWFVEAQQNPAKAPILLWMNGGPACSSLGGLFNENGPFQVSGDGATLIENRNSWNKAANMLYLETPAGTGFSYSTNNQPLGDDIVAQDNLLAIQSFFKKYPQYKKNQFFISGESYGGIYVSLLAQKIMDSKAMANFQGFAIGNGCMDNDVNLNSLLFFIYYHGFMDSQRWDKIEKFCCDGGVSPYGCNFKKGHDTPCQKAGLEALNRFLKADLNAYNIYQNCNRTQSNNTRYVFDLHNLLTSIGYSKSTYKIGSWDRSCMEVSSMFKYLNNKAVRQAIHAAEHVKQWVECNSTVNSQYNKTYPSMRNFLLKILQSGKVRGLIYNGDVDMVCNFLGEEWFAHKLGLQVLEPYSQWKYDDQIAGFVTYYKKLSFLTLKGSGHMVPKDKPEQALTMITKFLGNQKY